jgi:hypothetical protein
MHFFVMAGLRPGHPRLGGSDDERNKNMSKFGKELIKSMQQAAKHAAGKRVRGLRVSKVKLPDVKALPCACRNITSPRRIGFRFPP